MKIINYNKLKEGTQILIKHKNRLQLCKIIEKLKETYKILIINLDVIIYKNLDKGNYIKYRKYNEPLNIYAIYEKFYYKIYCDFCHKSHTYEKLGKNHAHCSSPYSPYFEHGFNILFELNNIKECLLHNYYKYVLYHTNNYYYTYFVNFINGDLCDNYGNKLFPYFTIEHINFIKKKYKDINYNCSNGGLIASIKNFILMMQTYKLQLFNYKNNKEIKKIIKYYKSINNKIL